ncbi:MAG TPA: hypothetical protein VKB26_06940 [Candidatus Acidoferrales bacterium]|nr:hypothetical protein [Candidatus Acidoferrales bacterium]
MEEMTLIAPQETTETGIRRGLLEDLTLKILYLNGEMTLPELAQQTCLSLGVIEQIFQYFRKQQLCEVKGMVGGTHRIVASAEGKQRAVDLLSLSQYAGPAPVSLTDYHARVRAQSVRQAEVSPTDLVRAFHSLVLDEELISRIGTAVVSNTSIFLYGPPGSGKTTLACNIPEIYRDTVWIPYAVEVDNQVIAVFDPGVHHRVDGPPTDEFDARWVLCRRPIVLAGGELSVEMLDLQYNSASRYYTAPLQMKANNGVLILDDFGRQRMRPDELLNRWMTPLDRRLDFLSLPGGKKFEIPFDLFVVFSTNLDPRELADDAFLRRIPNKIKVNHATPEHFCQILRNECVSRGITCDSAVPEEAARFIRDEIKQSLSQSLPRDLLNQISWAATYRGDAPRLTSDAIKQACRNYFLPVEG